MLEPMVPRTHTSVRRRLVLKALAASGLLVFGSCQKVPLLAPTQSVITVVSSRSILPINGNAEITATVIEESGTPAHNGTLVTFTSTLGTLDPTEAVTSNGQAKVTLRAGTQSGTAEILAFSGSARTEAPITVLIGGAAAAGIAVTANPAVLSATGGAVEISAAVSDASGNRLNGVPVSFSATSGSLGTTQATTNVNGIATTTLTTSVSATVTATVSGTITGTVAVTVNPAPSISITQTTASPAAGGTTTFSVVTGVEPGGAPIATVSVDFGDGSPLASLGSVTGTASVSHVYGVAGTYQVVATVVDTTGQGVTASAVVRVTPAVPINVTLSASPAQATVNEAVTFTANTGTTTVPIQHFDWTFGDGTSIRTSGNSTSHVYTTAGNRTVTVTASNTDGTTGTAQITLVVAPSVFSVNLTFSPSSPKAGSAVTFTATVSPSTTVVSRYDWDFDDGFTTTGSANSVPHTYNWTTSETSKTFTVEVTAFRALDGASTATQVTVTVDK